ncbi:hypothetical protein AYO44_09990 [Planctomycetaceae bacterium SCGC AG-212-F19]|nr:hypothetical protein AYO44_09990 [Planctomycetaceae bacterium SCGC AG-212-F19]
MPSGWMRKLFSRQARPARTRPAFRPELEFLENREMLNAGNILIAGAKFNDLNANGQRDPGEPGLAGWTIQLYTQTAGQLSAVPLQATTTDSNGQYAFSGLDPLPSGSDYVVAEAAQDGWQQTFPQSNSAGTIALPNGMQGYVVPGSGLSLTTSGGIVPLLGNSGNVQLNQLNNSTAAAVSFDDGAGHAGTDNTVLAQFQVTYTSGSAFPEVLDTWCIDLEHNVGVGQTYAVQPRGDLAGAFANGSRMAYIFEHFGQQDLSNDPVQAGAVTLALWDLSLSNHNPTHFGKDADGSYSSGDPNVFRVQMSDGNADAIAQLTDQYLVESLGATNQDGWFDAAPAGDAQNRGQSLLLPVAHFDFGNRQLGSIAGQVFDDTDGDGVKGFGEPGLVGWTVFLDGNGNNTLDPGEQSVQTDGSGNYSFTNVVPGTYTVREVTMAGWNRTTANPPAVAVGAGDNAAGGAFGNFKRITISGQKFNDLNGNGLKDPGDTGLVGWTITLRQVINNQIVDRTTVTDDFGLYSFSDVGPGDTFVFETQQDGWQQTARPFAQAFQPRSGGDLEDRDFGNFKLITITGQKFEDVNGNGLLDPGEAGLQGWTINLTGTIPPFGRQISLSTTTDANGFYSFQVGPGTYTVREQGQDGWKQITADPPAIAAQSGQDVANINFGNFKYITVTGVKFDDTNGNGARDAGEPSLQGWTIQLINPADGSVVQTKTTDANGAYSFNFVGPGNYRLREVPQAGWTQSSANPPDFQAQSAQNVVANFGNFHLVTISGMKFDDTNGNGAKDAAETGLPNWTIQLISTADGTVKDTAVTDDFGDYSFFNVGPGTYRLREVQQTDAGWLQTSTNPADVTTRSGVNVANVDFGNVQPAVLLNSDLNIDGNINNADVQLKTTRGAYVVVNNDDDNRNGVVDTADGQVAAVAGVAGSHDEADMKRVNIDLSMLPQGLQNRGIVTLSRSNGNIRVYSDPRKGVGGDNNRALLWSDAPGNFAAGTIGNGRRTWDLSIAAQRTEFMNLVANGLFVEGVAGSAAARDTSLTISYTPQGAANPLQTDELKITVIQFNNITASVPVSQSLRAGAPAVPNQTFSNAPGVIVRYLNEFVGAGGNRDANFDTPNALVMIRGSADPFQVDVSYNNAAAAISWVAIRAGDDAAALGGAGALPTLTPNAATPTRAALGTNQHGSFYASAYVDANGNGRFDVGEPRAFLPYILADVSAVTDASRTNAANITATLAGGSFNFSSGAFNIAAPGTAGIYMNANVDLIGGGANQTRGLDRVFGGWLNNLAANSVATAQYTNNHHAEWLYASNVPANRRFLPADAVPNLVAAPILDTGRPIAATGGNTVTLGRSQIGARGAIPGGAAGQRLQIEAVDSPSRSFLRANPGFPGSVLTSVRWNHRFQANLTLWTDARGNIGADGGTQADAGNRLYSVVEQYTWSITATWNINNAAGTIAVVAAPAITQGAVSTFTPARPAPNRDVEVRPPTSLSQAGVSYRL